MDIGYARISTDGQDLALQLDEHGVSFRSLTWQIDATTPGGTLLFHIFAALAEFERYLIRERTMAGLAAARARGRKGGRPERLDTDRKVQMARQLHADTNNPIEDICKALRISRATLSRYLQPPSPRSEGVSPT